MYRDDKRKKGLVYWYSESKIHSVQGIGLMLRSFIRQLAALMTDVPDNIQQLWQDHHKRGTQPHTNELMSTFHAVLTHVQRDVFLLIDALDVRGENHIDTSRKRLIAFLTKLVEYGPEIYISS